MRKISVIIISVLLASCGQTKNETAGTPEAVSIKGTWKLISGTLIEKGDTTYTDYTKGKSFIKIINDTHFAFLLHDLTNGKDSTALFSSGGGAYSLKDRTYTEHLEYCTDRKWEGNDFTFAISVMGDTLVQSGVEIIEKEGINRLNIEKYIRLKN